MNCEAEIIGILISILNIEGDRASITSDTRLLGALPEFDSMAVVALIEALEDHFGFIANDDEMTESTFLSVGQLVQYVEGKLAQ